MADRTLWVGSIGPFHFDDVQLFADGSRHRLATSRAPTDDNDVVRFEDIDGTIGTPTQMVETGTPLDPTELNALTGSSVGAFALVADPDATGIDVMTLYGWDPDPVVGENPPYLVDGVGGGMWVAIAGRYINTPITFHDYLIMDGDVTINGETTFDDVIELTTGARVTKYLQLSPSAISGVGANAATLGLNGGNWLVWSFADAAEEQVQFNFMVPDDMELIEDAEILILWSSPTISQDCDWELSYLITAPDNDTEAVATDTNQDYVASSATGDGLVNTSMITIAGGTIVVGDLCIHVVLQRDGDDGSDNLGDVAELHGVLFKYLANKLGE